MAKKDTSWHSLFSSSDLIIFIVILHLTTTIELEAVGQGIKKVNSTGQINSKDSNKSVTPIKTAVDTRNLVFNAPARIDQLSKSKFAPDKIINKLDGIKKRKLRRELERDQEQDVEEYSTVIIEPSSSPDQRNNQEMNSVPDSDYPQELTGSASTEESNNIEGTNSNPNNTTVDPSNQAAANNDVERLVRTQVDLAATNWATFAPNEYLPHLNTYPDSSQASGWLEQNVTQKHQSFPNHRMDNSQRNKFYPNHNYKHDPNTSNPFWQHNPHNDFMDKSLIGQESSSTFDPMTTLPDSSNRFGSFQDSGDSHNQYERTTPAIDLSKVTQNHHHQLRYMYRLRGPMTATTVSQAELARPTVKPIALSRSHPTLAQNILKTFERLDGIRTSQDRFDTVPSTSRVDLTRVVHKTSNDESASSAIATPIHNLFSNLPGAATEHSGMYSGKISSKGFMDGPMSSGLEGDQKNHAGSVKDARVHDHDSKNTIQSTSESGKGNTEDKLPVVTIEYNRRPSMLSKTQAMENERAKNGLHTRAYKMGHTNVGTSANQRSTLPSPVNRNLNGSLAARLNANRYKNKQPAISSSQTPSPVSSAGSLFYTPEPLTINFKKLHNQFRKPIFGSTTLPNPSDTVKPSATSTTTALRMEVPIQRGSILIRNDPPVKPTTAMLPTSTYPTVAPNLAPALYAAAINSANSNKSNNSNSAASSVNYAARPAHHHHLHSHVHSIKPAVISIPIPIQPKFGAYESMLAAAAAAAAAASAGATRLARKPLLVQPMQPSVPRLQATRPVPRKFFPIPIPIGGTLSSTRTAIPKMMPDQGTLASYQNPSILTNLLDSANKALKQVTGNTASLLSLQMNGNHPESIISKKAALVYPHLYTKQREGSGDFLGLPMYSASQEHDSFENPIESIGLYQAPITLNSDSSPVYSYLEDLLSAVPPEDYLSNQTSQYEAIVPILTESQRLKSQPFAHQQQQQNVVDWDSNTTLHSLNDADNVIFASLGGNPNLLYPLMSQDKANLGANGDQFLVNGAPLSDQSSNMMNAFEAPLWDKRRPQAQHMDNSLPSRTYKKSLSKGNSMKEHSSKTKGRNNYLDGNGGQINRPPYSPDKHRPSLASQHQFESPMQYALSHYAQDQAAYNQDNQQNSLMYDVFDDKNNKFSYPQGVEYFATPETMDGFRPISQPSYYYSTPNNASSYLDAFHNQVGLKSNPPNILNSNHQPVVHAHNNDAQASQEKAKKANGAKFGSQRNPGQALGHTSQQGLKELFQHSNLEQPTTLIQFLPHNIYPTELMHHAMANAGSSIKPHIIAANDLINYHKQHLIDHHFMHHHYQPNSGSHQDMATSESARLAVSSPIRGSLLTHFMPLALAMIPIMVVVAMLAQLVMTAPLIMFAMTTLAVSRLSGALFGPLSAREEPFRIDSILSGHSLLNNTLAKLKSTGEPGSTGSSGNFSGNTSGNRRKRRRKRDIRGSFKAQHSWPHDGSKHLIKLREHFGVLKISL